MPWVFEDTKVDRFLVRLDGPRNSGIRLDIEPAKKIALLSISELYQRPMLSDPAVYLYHFHACHIGRHVAVTAQVRASGVCIASED